MEIVYNINEDMPEQTIAVTTKCREKSVESWIKSYGERHLQIVGTREDKKFSVPVEKCTRFFSHNKAVYCVADDMELKLSKKLYELEDELPKHFVRISNSEILNVKTIQEMGYEWFETPAILLGVSHK